MRTPHFGFLSHLAVLSTILCGCLAADDYYYGSFWSDSNVVRPPNDSDAVSDSFERTAFTNPLNAPQSTFAADVDTASYTLFRYRIQHHLNPQNTANSYGVATPYRTEEMINYFKYDYPAPKADEVFSITTEYADCPWNEETKLLLIGTQTRKIEEIPPSNLVFLIDVSGSMYHPEKLDLLKASLLALLPSLTSEDKLSIVTYASNEKLILEGADPVKDKNKIEKAIKSLNASGSTYGERGLEMAYEVAQKYFIENGNNRIIMGTDGDLNVGISTVDELKTYVEQKRDLGIYLSIFGFGLDNYNEAVMETIADNGNGSYHHIDSILEAERVLVEDRASTLFVAAKDVKYQVSFNPAMIKGYRLIGYENRVMSAEDFVDDKKDGGEIGVNHQVTALYEIAEIGANVAIDAIDTTLSPEMPEFKADEAAKLAVRYKMPSGDAASIEKNYTIDLTPHEMSANMAFAAAVTELSMMLNQSQYVGTSSKESIQHLLSIPPSEFQDKYKLEFKELVSQAFYLMK